MALHDNPRPPRPWIEVDAAAAPADTAPLVALLLRLAARPATQAVSGVGPEDAASRPRHEPARE
jgi:hypothetical protein